MGESALAGASGSLETRTPRPAHPTPPDPTPQGENLSRAPAGEHNHRTKGNPSLTDCWDFKSHT